MSGDAITVNYQLVRPLLLLTDLVTLSELTSSRGTIEERVDLMTASVVEKRVPQMILKLPPVEFFPWFDGHVM